jgi:hypothetical protein
MEENWEQFLNRLSHKYRCHSPWTAVRKATHSRCSGSPHFWWCPHVTHAIVQEEWHTISRKLWSRISSEKQLHVFKVLIRYHYISTPTLISTVATEFFNRRWIPAFYLIKNWIMTSSNKAILRIQVMQTCSFIWETQFCGECVDSFVIFPSYILFHNWL